jgi:SAM-dependent methyltransferase
VTVFAATYAGQYDLLYQDKDYAAECDLIESAIRRFGQGPVQSILDMGCGTGNHTIPLTRRGYSVTGLDLSPEMLSHARQKVAETSEADGGSNPEFIQADVRSADLGRKFDVVLMMFAVLGYQHRNQDVMDALHTVRKHLRPGGLFICDFWYGPAVLAIRPTDRVKVVELPDGKIIRAATGCLNLRQQRCDVRYDSWHIQGKRVQSETTETHGVRFFFPMELEIALKCAGLDLLSLSSVSDFDQPADETTWNALSCARLE